MPLELGEKIYVESLLSDEEWKEQCRLYSTTCRGKKPEVFDCDFKWRYRMGMSVTQAEIDNIKANIKYLLDNVKSE